MMTRQDFIELAEVIKQAREHRCYTSDDIITYITEGITQVCENSNDGFNKEKFLKACE